MNVIGGGCYENVYAYWVNKGFLCVNGAINAGVYNAADPTFPGQTDILHNSTGITTFIGGRSESQNILYITAGKANIIGTLHNQPIHRGRRELVL